MELRITIRAQNIKQVAAVTAVPEVLRVVSRLLLADLKDGLSGGKIKKMEIQPGI